MPGLHPAYPATPFPRAFLFRGTHVVPSIRWAVQILWDSRSPQPVTPSEALAFTLRSLKVSLLSATAQLRLSDEAHRRQGHHKQQSVDLYGRDDTIDALWLQLRIALACSEGWRPSRPIRSSPHATTLFPSPALTAPLRLDISKTPWDLERFTCHRELQQLSGAEPARQATNARSLGRH